MSDSTNHNTDGLTLYSMTYCPYCVYVVNAMAEMGIELPVRDIYEDPGARDELVAGGGKGQVPCLRIEQPGGSVQWMYESQDIVQYLHANVLNAS